MDKIMEYVKIWKIQMGNVTLFINKYMQVLIKKVNLRDSEIKDLSKMINLNKSIKGVKN